ncbi:hypothetical protein JHK87_018409 [Glycine soja]|nr:hypothetical protein JHK87_018409 [Glycine soja]
MMNGKIPKSIGQLTQLNTLNLFQNNWDGTMTNIHFHNLTNLFSFSVSSKTNSFAFKATHDWIPPFKQLYYLKIHGCQVGPTFPNWLRNQTGLEYVILENAGISGEIPRWLYNMFSHIRELDLSHSKISGYLPKTLNFSIPLWCTITALDLRNNSLSGTVPANIGEEMSNMEYLDLSNNNLNGSIPQSINRMQLLLYLDLSNNYLTRVVPVFSMSIQHLSIIDLSNNSLSGGIPTSLCSLPSIFILELSNNNLSTNLSTVFQNCTSMGSLSLGNNKFFGSVPKKINKNFPILEELLLRGNTLTGSIPEELCGLPSLHLLDLRENKKSLDWKETETTEEKEDNSNSLIYLSYSNE